MVSPYRHCITAVVSAWMASHWNARRVSVRFHIALSHSIGITGNQIISISAEEIHLSALDRLGGSGCILESVKRSAQNNVERFVSSTQ